MQIQNPVLHTTIAGIPAQVTTDIWGDLVIMDRKGYRANWLAKKLTVRDWMMLEDEYVEYCQEQLNQSAA